MYVVEYGSRLNMYVVEYDLLLHLLLQAVTQLWARQGSDLHPSVDQGHGTKFVMTSKGHIYTSWVCCTNIMKTIVQVVTEFWAGQQFATDGQLISCTSLG